MGWTSEYALENESGERYELTAPAPVYMVNVQGLGVTTRRKYDSLGAGFFQLTNDDTPQNPIAGDLIYKAGAFGNYQNLVNCVMRAKTLYFCYAPLEDEYRCRVRLNYINKSARDGAGWMRAAISFHPLTPLYQPVETQVVEPDGPNVKAYLEHDGEYYYTYNSDLVYGHEITGDLVKQIVPAGHEPSAFLLRYTGSATNPVITVTGASGVVYGECHVDDTLDAGETLELCTVPDNCYVHKIKNGVVHDLMADSKVDLAYNPYRRAPVDEISILKVDADDPLPGTTELIVYRYYRSV
jgi:hypothetical protein